MVRLAGIEPTTPWFVAKYSIQLSYSRESADSNIAELLRFSQKWEVSMRLTEDQNIGFLRQAPEKAGAENSRLKRLLTESMLENEVTKDA